MSDEYDYFDMFDLSRQDTRQVNYKKLQELVYKENQRHGRQAETRQSLLKQAVSSFKNETEYQNYLKKLNVQNSSTDSKRQAELEKERQKEDREAEERWKAQADEEAKRQAVDAEKRTIEAQQQAASPFTTKLLHKLGDSLKGKLNLPEDGVRATAIDFLVDHLSNKQTQASQPSVNQQPAITRQAINLSGNWRDFDGAFGAFYAALNYSITHSGGWLKMQGKTWGILVMEGEGTVSGQFARIDEYKVTNGTTGQLELEISADGRSLKGTCTNFSTGVTFRVHFVRI